MLRPSAKEEDISTPPSIGKSHTQFTAAGVLVLVSLAGAMTASWLWWALVPAAILMALGLATRPRFAGKGAARAIALVSAAVLAATCILSLIGLVVTQRTGLEPAWLQSSTEVIALCVLAALVAVGVLVSRGGQPGIGAILASSLPAGIAIDYSIEELLPPGFFLEGAGYYLGMFLLGFSLIRIGRPTSSESAGTPQRTEDAPSMFSAQV